MIRYEEISQAIQVRHLQVSISEALAFAPTDGAEDAARAMAFRGFDQAPVIAADRVVGLVHARRLREGVAVIGEAIEAINPQHLVSADAPVARALGWLMETPCLFVLDGREITGFFVEADLNKQPARTYFFLLVASLEAGLAQTLRSWASGDEARLLEAMPPDVRARVVAQRNRARSEDVDADLVALLYFSEILPLVGSIPEIWDRLDVGGATEWQWTVSRLRHLRNAVMHPTRDLVGREAPLAGLVELETLLRNLLVRVEGLAQSKRLPDVADLPYPLNAAIDRFSTARSSPPDALPKAGRSGTATGLPDGAGRT